MEGGTILELTPRTVGVRGGFAHVYQVTFEDDAGQLACVYLQRWLAGDGPAIGERLHWQEGDLYIADFITDASGNRLRKFGEAFNKPEDE